VANIVLRALKPIRASVHAVLCDESSREALAPLAEAEGFDIFPGPEQDVLSRFVVASTVLGVQQIIRATGDNPLVSAPLAESILNVHLERSADLSHYLGCPLGTGVEVIDSVALRDAALRARDPFEREHLTQHLYRNRHRYCVVEEPCPEACRLEEAHVSVDTEDDYAKVVRIFEELYDGTPIRTEELVDWLKGERAIAR
jgi:spore coat polysaccharide biosynthesis protein SpsF